MNTLSTYQPTIENTASILANNLIDVLNDNTATPRRRLDESLRPFAAIQWNRSVINHIAIAKINRLFGRLKRSRTPKATLKLEIDHFHRALSDEPSIIPIQFPEWWGAITRSSLTNLDNSDTWVAAWTSLESHRIPDIAKLANVSLLEIQTIADTSPFGELFISLWKAVRIERAHERGLSAPVVDFWDNSARIPEALRGPIVELTAIGEDYLGSKTEIGIPVNFDEIGPMSRKTALQEATPDSQQLLRFLAAGAQPNILQQVRLTLPAVASGVSRYLAFCSLLSITPFPPTSTIVQQRGNMFGQGKTFQIYVSRLTKACHLLQIDCSWKDEAVKAVIKGIANKPPRNQRFSNPLSPEWLDLLTRAKSWESEFALL